MKNYHDLEKEYYENKKRMRRMYFSFAILTSDGKKEYHNLKSRNEKIKTLFEDYGIKL